MGHTSYEKDERCNNCGMLAQVTRDTETGSRSKICRNCGRSRVLNKGKRLLKKD